MSDWEILLTDQAELDLRKIYEYIAFKLLEPETAKKQYLRILEGIYKLDQMPKRHPLYDKEPWKSKGLRRKEVDHYSIFYIPFEKYNIVVIVVVSNIIYSGRNIEEILRENR
jgi:toxin ParE1/3/4